MHHKMKLKYGDFELELEGERDFVENRSVDISALVTMLIQKSNTKEIDQLNNEPKQLPIQTNAESVASTTKKSSFAEFLASKSFKNDVDLVLGTGYFIEEIEMKGAFTSKVITEYLKKAKQPSPKNIALCFTGNTQKGYLIPYGEKIDGKLAYEISTSGIGFIERYKPGERKNGKNKPKKPKENQHDLEVLKFSIDELHLENYCDIHKLTRTEDKALLIIKIYSAECGVSSLSLDEVEAILRLKFSIPVTYDSIKAALRIAKPKVEGVTTEGKLKYRIMAPGEKYLKELIEKIAKGE